MQFHKDEQLTAQLTAQFGQNAFPENDFDGVGDFYARSLDDIIVVFNSTEFAEIIVPDEEKFTNVEEGNTVSIIGYDLVDLADSSGTL